MSQVKNFSDPVQIALYKLGEIKSLMIGRHKCDSPAVIGPAKSVQWFLIWQEAREFPRNKFYLHIV